MERSDRVRLAELRRELHECYKQEDRPYGRIDEIAGEIAGLPEDGVSGRDAEHDRDR